MAKVDGGEASQERGDWILLGPADMGEEKGLHYR
jgi:hypothetical protein